MKKIENKKGLSEIVGYVLLVVIAISLSLLVYAWLRNYLPKETESCPDEVSIMIQDCSFDSSGNININLKNNGLFNIEGFLARISNKTGQLPVYPLNGTGLLQGIGEFYFINASLDSAPLEPNQNFSDTFSFKGYNQIVEIEIIPIKETLLCNKAAIRQGIENCYEVAI